MKLPYMYIGRKFKQDKNLNLNMQHTSSTLNSELQSQTT